MNEILLITDVDFWNEGAGHRMRIQQLVVFLARYHSLTVGFIGQLDSNVAAWIEAKSKISVIVLDSSSKPATVANIARVCARKKFGTCIVEFIHLTYCLKGLPPMITTILDIHDIISARSAEFRQNQAPIWGYEISEDTELQIFRMYDYVMVICSSDSTAITAMIRDVKTIIAPHAVDPVEHPFNRETLNIGFIGSEYTPNVDAITFFVKDVWSKFKRRTNIMVNIYGNVCNRLQGLDTSGVLLRGYTDNLYNAYNEIDVFINPVRFGAGMKIKNIEALAHGRPLITTSHGSRGIESGINTAFLVADSPAELLRLLLSTVEDHMFRRDLGLAAFEYVNTQFSSEACYGSLLDIIKGSKQI